MESLVEVVDSSVDPTTYLVVKSAVDVDPDTVVEQVATRPQAERQRVELVETSTAGRVDPGHVEPFTRRTAQLACVA